MTRHFRKILLAIFLAIVTSLASASDWVIERSWVEDPTGTMTLAEVQQMPTTPLVGKMFTQGYSYATFWIRLRIDPTQQGLSPTDKLVVRIRPPYQDQIRLFDPLAPQDKVRITGDHYDWADDEYRSLNLNFVIPAGEQPRDIWLSLKASLSTMTLIEVMTEDQVRAADRHQEMLTMLYLSVLFICLGWAVLTRINRKDALLSCYLVREVMIIIYALTVLGYLRIFTSGWLPPVWVDTLSNLLAFGYPAVVVWFDSRLIGQFKPNRWLARLHFSMVWFFPVEAVLVFMGRTTEAARLSSLLIIAILVLVIACVISTQAWAQTRHAPPNERPPYPKWLLVLTYTIVVAIIFLNRLPLMGVTLAQEYYLYFSLVFPLLTSITLMGLVQIHLFRQAKVLAQDQRRAELAEVDAQNERARRKEQTNFLRMLTHELKTPLSVLRLIADSALKHHKMGGHADKAINDINGIINRCIKVDQLTVVPQPLQAVTVDPLEIIVAHIAAENAEARCNVLVHGRPELTTDPLLFKTVVNNLIDNALKYAAHDTLICIELAEVKVGQVSNCRIVIQNEIGKHGAPDSDKVFHKYYRNPMAVRETGSGLGLYLVKTLVERLGGQVRYTPQTDVVLFEIDFPNNVPCAV